MCFPTAAEFDQEKQRRAAFVALPREERLAQLRAMYAKGVYTWTPVCWACADETVTKGARGPLVCGTCGTEAVFAECPDSECGDVFCPPMEGPGYFWCPSCEKVFQPKPPESKL